MQDDPYDIVQDFRNEINETIKAAKKLGVTVAELVDVISVFRITIRASITSRPKELQPVLNKVASESVAEYIKELQKK